MKNYDNVVIFDHPLIRHKIAILRDKNTSTKEFRELVEEITTLMTYECFKDVPTVEKEVDTPLETCTQRVVKDNSVAIVPILRAGLGMVNGIHAPLPQMHRQAVYRLPREAFGRNVAVQGIRGSLREGGRGLQGVLELGGGHYGAV